MADEKKAPAPEEPIAGKTPDAGKTDAPEKPEGRPVADTIQPPEEKVPEDKSKTGMPDKDGAEVVVPIEKISELIAQRNLAAREQAEQNAPPDKAPEGKQMGLFETTPTPKRGGRPTKAAKEPKDKPPQEKKPRDKVSQGKRGKNTPDKPAGQVRTDLNAYADTWIIEMDTCCGNMRISRDELQQRIQRIWRNGIVFYRMNSQCITVFRQSNRECCILINTFTF